MRTVSVLLLVILQLILCAEADAAPIRVRVWDERQPAQKQAYTNFLGNEIAAHLRKSSDFKVESVCLDDAGQGLLNLDGVDVLVWWGHVRQGEIKPETAQDIARRIKAGKLALIALHSAHWSQPFVEAMRERSRMDALAALPLAERTNAVFVETNLFANFRTPPKYESMRTPSVVYRKPTDGTVEIRLALPNCCFPGFRNDGKPSQITVLQPNHPITKGLPAQFILSQTEMYDEPFHVPPPDEVVLEEKWQTGEWFRSGMVWQLGKGRVFYFRPGHETFPIYTNANALKVVENAVYWLGGK